MRSLGAAEQHPPAGVLLPTMLDDCNDSVLGSMHNVNRFRGLMPL